MQVQVNHDNHVRVGEDVSARLARVIEDSLMHYGERITRIEMYLADENGDKGGADDKRCTLEARVANLSPIAVTAQAETLQLAIDGAIERLDHALEHAIGKRESH
jgi:ribosome-associated translation inhibitor RaiA